MVAMNMLLTVDGSSSVMCTCLCCFMLAVAYAIIADVLCVVVIKLLISYNM